MKKIPLRNRYKEIVGHAIVSDKDFKRVNEHRWYLHAEGYAATTIKDRTVYLHRFILNPPKGVQVDHKRSKKLDCRDTKIRPCNEQQNAANRTKKLGLLYKGVYRLPSGKWKVSISFQRKTYDLHYSQDPEECAIYYDVAAQLCFGEFARINGV